MKTEETYYVYALKSTERNYIYVGLTNDINRRVNEHNKGYNKTTKPYAPFRLIYTEPCEDRPSARVREKYLKTTSGKRFLRSLIDSEENE